MMTTTVVINFHHALTDRAMQALERLIPGGFYYVHERLKIDFDADLAEQIARTVTAAESALRGLSRAAPESLEMAGRLFIIAPGLSDPSALLVPELVGRTGFFPSLVLMRRDADAGGYLPYGVIDGEVVKQKARNRRQRQLPVERGKGS